VLGFWMRKRTRNLRGGTKMRKMILGCLFFILMAGNSYATLELLAETDKSVALRQSEVKSLLDSAAKSTLPDMEKKDNVGRYTIF
jgi:hypothetical protein